MNDQENNYSDLKVDIARIRVASDESNKRLDRIEKSLDAFHQHVVLMATLTAKVERNEARIVDLESSRRWAVKLVIGAVITAGLSLLFFKPGLASAAVLVSSALF